MTVWMMYSTNPVDDAVEDIFNATKNHLFLNITLFKRIHKQSHYEPVHAIENALVANLAAASELEPDNEHTRP